MSVKGESGYEPAGNQTGVLLPTFSSWYDSPAATKADYKLNPSKAATLLGWDHGPEMEARELELLR